MLVGAGTLRHEGYGAVRLSDDRAGLAARARPAAVPDPGGRLRPRSTSTRPAPVSPTRRYGRSCSPHDRARAAGAPALAAVADVVRLRRVAWSTSRSAWPSCASAGWRQVLCEGGPHLFGALLAADLVDELCLTCRRVLAGPGAGRIVAGPSRRGPVRHAPGALIIQAGERAAHPLRRVTAPETSTCRFVSALAGLARCRRCRTRGARCAASRDLEGTEAGHERTSVGRVLGTFDATPLQFWVAVRPGAYLQLDDVVVTTPRAARRREPVTIAGVVTQVRARHEGASFDSDVFAIADGTLPAQVQEAAEITTTRVEPEIYVPPAPGALVRRAGGAERDGALYFDRMDRRVPIGIGPRRRAALPQRRLPRRQPGRPRLDLRHLRRRHEDQLRDLAALLGLPLRRARRRRRDGQHPGPDLQRQGRGPALPRPPEHQARRATRARPTPGSGLDAGPFPDVCVYAPPRAGDSTGAPDVASRLTGVDTFYWTLAEFCADRLLPYVFADADDDRQQYTMVVHAVAAYLHRNAEPADGGVVVDGVRVNSYPDLVDLIAAAAAPMTRPAAAWAGSAVGLGTVNAFLRRLISSSARPVPADPRRPADIAAGTRINTAESAQVTVVDLHNLPDRAQRFVVGVILKTRVRAQGEGRHRQAAAVRRARRAEQVRPPRGLLPDQGGAARHRRAGPLARRGADRRPADRERGRAPHPRATRRSRWWAGSTRPRRAARSTASCPPAQRQRALIAKPGTMFVSQPDIPVPLVAEFPFPAWATRPVRGGRRPERHPALAGAVDRPVRGGRRGPVEAGGGIPDDDIPF